MPQRQHDAVAAQDEARQHPGAGHRTAGSTLVAVVAQEQLLERRRPAREAAHAGLREQAERLVEPRRVDREAHLGAVDAQVVDALEPGEAVDGLVGLDDDRRAGEVPQLVERAGLDRAPGPDDPHAMAERLDLGEDVAGQQHGAARGADLGDALLEDRLHQRVQAGGGLVEDQQLGVRGQRRHERDLLAVALRVGAPLLGRVQVEALEQVGAAARIEAAAQAAQQVDRLAAGQVGPQVHVARHVGEPPVQRHAVAPGVAAQEPRLAGVGAQQAEQDADRRRLAGAVGAEEAVHLAGLDGQVQPVERARGTEGLDRPDTSIAVAISPQTTPASHICEICE